MNLESIGYFYRFDELSTLMSLQGVPAIRCLPSVHVADREAFSRAIRRMEEDGILQNAGGTVLLDRVHALLIRNLCECDSFVRVEMQDDCSVACICRQLCLFLQLQRTGWTVTPLQTPERLAEEAGEAWEDLAGEAEITVWASGSLSGQTKVPEGAAGETAMRELRELLDAVSRHDDFQG